MSENDMVEMAVQTGIRIAQLEQENEELRRRVEEL